MAPRLVLGSGSPRRLELLGRLGLEPAEIRAPDIDETPLHGELPRPYCERMAREKALASAVAPGEVVLCADTTVAAGRRILGKPADADEARKFLKLLSGRRHKVITAVAVRTDERLLERVSVSSVRFKRLSQDEISGYIASGDWRGKAGGYAIQGSAEAFIPWIEGSYSAIMGLPLAETAHLLMAAGLPVWRSAA
ncbi:Maf family protein [Palleronia caenipelagi]|uniref:dTTP/UTP pyrophosphatase n=1 Tax=Palleronia caenipelagi TaxID=2489174 RepID=A0A547PLU2_9RHOB|nr:nucleoside triphosphate pyrophosphatase [Palleronia caenipelagi]TRD14994.1 septum formation inhibitor Maf [Palleronia caenipelagi]